MKFFGNTQEDMPFKWHLEIVLQKIVDAGLTAKCNLATGEVSYLDYIFGGGVICAQVDKIEAVRACPATTTNSRVREG